MKKTKKPFKKTKLFDLKIVTCENLIKFCKHLINTAKAKTPQSILPITMNEVLISKDHKKIKKEISSFDYITPDGMPLVFLLRVKNKKRNIDRIYGPELMLEMCRQSEKTNLTHYFYGSTQNVLKKLKKELRNKFPKLKIVGTHSPPFKKNHTPKEKRKINSKIAKLRPSFVWVGLGSEKQISWIAKNKYLLPTTTIVAVGAAFDFISKNKPQAPKIIRGFGLEWLFRFLTEPKRLFKRYILQLPTYFYLILLELMKNLRFTK